MMTLCLIGYVEESLLCYSSLMGPTPFLYPSLGARSPSVAHACSESLAVDHADIHISETDEHHAGL